MRIKSKNYEEKKSKFYQEKVVKLWENIELFKKKNNLRE